MNEWEQKDLRLSLEISLLSHRSKITFFHLLFPHLLSKAAVLLV